MQHGTGRLVATQRGLLATALAAICCNAYATDAPTRLPAIEVRGDAESGYAPTESSTATKMDVPIRDIPQSIEVRTRLILDDLGGQQTSYDVARTVAGVFSAENGGGDPGRNVPNFLFRGYGNSGVYLKDGHLVNGWMSTLDMANIERVEFLKGPASVLYGGTTYAGNIGGVANYVSKLPQVPPLAAADFSVGSHGFVRATADLGQPVNADKTLLFRVNGAFEQGNSFREFAEHDTQFLAPALAWKPLPAGTLTLLADVVRSDEIPAEGLPLSPESFGVPRTRNYIDPGFAKTDINADYVAARYEHLLAGGWRFNVDLAHTRSRTDSFGSNLTYAVGGGSSLDASHWNFSEDQTSLDLRASGIVETGTLKHNLLFGFNANRNKYVADSDFGWAGPSLPLAGETLDQIVLPPPGSLTALYAETPATPGVFRWSPDADALYVQDLISVTPEFKALLGARHDRFDEHTATEGSFGDSDGKTSNSHTSPRLGAVYQPASATSIYALYAESFTPNSGITLNNAAPPPELGRLGEIGLKQSLGDRLNLNLALFDLTRRNMTFGDPADPDGVAVLVAGETRSRGVELDLNGQVTDDFRVNVAAAIVKGGITEGEPGGSLSVGQEFAGLPRYTLNLFGVYTFGPGRAWEVGGGVYYASEAWADADNSFRVPSYLQFDALAAYRFNPRTRLQFNLRNLTNRENYTSNGWGWINPGEPTAVYATLRHQF